MRVLALSVVAAAGLGAGVTAAADLKTGEGSATSQSNPWDVAFGVAVMNDYNWRGITVSARRPSVEVYLEPRYRAAENLELYAGVSGANVDLSNGSRAQIVYYAGTRPSFGALLLDIGGWYIDYPHGTTFNGLGSADTCTNGAFFFGQCNTTKAVASYFEAYAKSVLTISETLAVGGNLYYAPSWANTDAPGTYASVGAKITIPNSMLPQDFGAYASAEIGRYWYGTTDAFYGVPAFPDGIKLPDYTTWNVGLTTTYKAVRLDLRYYDTNLSKANCNVLTADQTATFGGPSAVTPINPSGLVSNWCSAAFVAKLAFDMTLADLR
ncbi:MAG TPA: TorF family putative porin [Xanthobacteraceae bacterium]|nr:TorF family putative porin [Xanthobacteraceae bacterium]